MSSSSEGVAVVESTRIGRTCRSDDAPEEPRLKIGEALGTNPIVFIFSTVALMQNVRGIFDHELGPAELAVVVVPGWVRGVAEVGTVDESDAL